jgi:hypothetical protein
MSLNTSRKNRGKTWKGSDENTRDSYKRLMICEQRISLTDLILNKRKIMNFKIKRNLITKILSIRGVLILSHLVDWSIIRKQQLATFQRKRRLKTLVIKGQIRSLCKELL